MSDNRKLPVWRTVAGAYGFLFRNRREALRIGWLPFVAVAVLDFVLGYLPDGDGWPTAALELYDFTVWVAYTPIVAMAVVPWHRYILLNQKIRGGAFSVAFSAREGRYIAVAVTIMALVTGMNWGAQLFLTLLDWIPGTESNFGALLYFFGSFFYLVVLIASIYLLTVLGLALPAVAADRNSDLSGALTLGDRNSGRLVLVMLTTGVPFYVFYWTTETLPDFAFEGLWALALSLVDSVLFVFEALIAASALSLCYRGLGGMQGNEPGTTMIPPSGGPA